MTYFLNAFGGFDYYRATDLNEFLMGSLALFGVILFFHLIKYLWSSKSKIDASETEEEPKVVSPFLITEMNQGERNFAVEKNQWTFRVIAIALIGVFVVTPMAEILFEENYYYLFRSCFGPFY